MVTIQPTPPTSTGGLLTDAQLLAANDRELAATLQAITVEQHRRALENNDIGALVEEAFKTGFVKNDPTMPWIHDGLLFCPGVLRYKSASSHDCTFVSVDTQWVWDHPGLLTDELRDVPAPHRLRHSISVVFAQEEMTLDVVSSTSRGNGPCQMKKVISFQIIDGELTQTSTRSRALGTHGSR